jgi:predicted amidohydrolase YtcJ
VNPFTALGAMVTRRSQTGADLDESEAVTPMQALAAYTTLGAWAQREENDKGSLERGKLADLAVLDTDILTCDPGAIRATRVVATAVGGVLRHGD